MEKTLDELTMGALFELFTFTCFCRDGLVGHLLLICAKSIDQTGLKSKGQDE